MLDWGASTNLGEYSTQEVSDRPSMLAAVQNQDSIGHADSPLPRLLNVSKGFLLAVLQWLEQSLPKGMSALAPRLGGNCST